MPCVGLVAACLKRQVLLLPRLYFRWLADNYYSCDYHYYYGKPVYWLIGNRWCFLLLKADPEPGELFRVDIGLLPLSHSFTRGSRIRVAIAPADRSQFLDRTEQAVSWRIFRQKQHWSRIKFTMVNTVNDGSASVFISDIR